MRFSKTFVALSLPYLASAAPARIYSRQATETDLLVLKFALVLENLEATFYEQGLNKFRDTDFTSAGFSVPNLAIEQLETIKGDEETHADVLEQMLKAYGSQPVPGCQFNFDSALTDVATMAATARVVEAVGVGAYMGAATLVSDKNILGAAASILTVEARHQSILNVISGKGSAIASPFDLALTPSEVLALAGPFISGCDLGVPANPVLQVTNTGEIVPGTRLTFDSPALADKDRSTLFCQMIAPGLAMSISLPFDDCVVPEINGLVGLFITKDSNPVINNAVQRTSDVVIAGPALAFIDTKPELIGQLARGGQGAPIRDSVSTRIISPSEASAIIQAAATGTAASSTGTSAVTTSAASSASTSASTETGASASSATSASSSVATGASSVATGSVSSTAAASSGAAGPVASTASQVRPAPAPGTPGGASTFTGLSKDGVFNVLGSSTVPATPST